MKHENYFFDPDKLPQRDRAYYEKITPIIEGILCDLKINGCLRRATKSETLHFINLMKDKEKIQMVFNSIVKIFEDREKIEDFLEKSKDYFTGEGLSYLYMSQLYFLCMVHVEMFRNFLLFYLKRGKNQRFKDKMVLGEFLRELKKISPKYGRLLEKELDVPLRNSFAHGLFRIEVEVESEPLLLCYKSLGELENPTRITLSDLLIEGRNHNIMYPTLAHLIAKKMKEGFFNDV